MHRNAVVRLAAGRALWSVFVLWLVSVLIFLATHVLPGDAATAILGLQATPEATRALEEQLHLNDSLISQYTTWLLSALQLDFGVSFSNGLDVAGYLVPTLVNSLSLMLGAAVIGIPLSLGLGLLTGYRRDGALDGTVTVLTLVLAALPVFVVGAMLVVIFSTGTLSLLPAIVTEPATLSNVGSWTLPAVTLALAIAPYIIRMMRATTVEILESEFVTYARLRGMRERTIILLHTLPNTLGPVSQVLALQLAYLFGGAVVVEYLFAYPGIGAALIDAVHNRDVPVLQAICMFIGAFYVLLNLIADIVTILATPKLRLPSR